MSRLARLARHGQRLPSLRPASCALLTALLAASLGCGEGNSSEAVTIEGSSAALSADRALQCLAGYAERGECDWAHWSELVEQCEIDGEAALDGDFLIERVRAGSCTWSAWPAIYDHLAASSAAPVPTAPVNTLDDALNCVAGYIHRGACDWTHWSELYEVCKTYHYPTLDDDYLLAKVRAGECSFASWPDIHAHAVSSGETAVRAPEPSPVQSLDDALECVAGYVRRDACDWTHWSELYDVCKTYQFPTLDDGFLLEQVKSGGCSDESWPAIYARATDTIALDDVADWPVVILPDYDESAALRTALACVGEYAQRDACDWEHWSELYEVCRTYEHTELDDGYLIDQVKAGACTAPNWPAIAAHITGEPLDEVVDVGPVSGGVHDEEGALHCLAGYAWRGQCDLAHWSELTQVCKTNDYALLSDGMLLDDVADGKCTWENWSAVYVRLRGVSRPGAGQAVRFEPRQPVLVAVVDPSVREAALVALAQLLVRSAQLPADDQALGRALGVSAADVAARFAALRASLADVRYHGQSWAAAHAAARSLASQLLVRAQEAEARYAPLSALIEAPRGAPDAAEREARYLAMLAELVAEIRGPQAAALSTEQTVHSFAGLLQTDNGVLLGLSGTQQSARDGQNNAVANTQSQIDSTLAALATARADYKYNTDVAASSAAYAWIWPWGTIAAASVAATYGPRATEALGRIQRYEGDLRTLTVRQAEERRQGASHDSAIALLAALQPAVSAALPGLQLLRGDWQRTRDDVDQLIDLVGTDMKRSGVVVRRALLKQTLAKWRSLADAALVLSR